MGALPRKCISCAKSQWEYKVNEPQTKALFVCQNCGAHFKTTMLQGKILSVFALVTVGGIRLVGYVSPEVFLNGGPWDFQKMVRAEE